jgi:Mg2+ and Co2+ transporter CorA
MRKEYEKEITEKDEDEEYKISPFYILYKIIDVMYDKTLKMLNRSTKDITHIEEDLFKQRI